MVTESFGEAEGFSGGNRGGAIEIRLWACNVLAFAVFQLCRVECTSISQGMAGGTLHWTGISPQQIASASWLCRVPRARRFEVASDVAYMGDRVAAERNQRDRAK